MASQVGEVTSDNIGSLPDSNPTDDRATNCSELLTSASPNHQNSDEEDDHVFSKDGNTASISPSTTDCSSSVAKTSDSTRSNGDLAKDSASKEASKDANQSSIPENSSQVLSPTATTSTTGGTRRPSYTSKAPSALTNLPGQSFEESLDGYSNPGTPSSVRADSPTAASPGNGSLGQSSSKHIDLREKNRLAFKTKWDEAIKQDVLPVKCRDMQGCLYKSKLGSGSKGKCIKTSDGHWITPTEFEARAGRKACKDWKRSIRYAGQTLQKLIDENILSPHAVSCTCATCGGDETLTGPVKLFVPYKGKRKRPHDAGSVSKPLDDTLHGFPAMLVRSEHHRMRSMSVDSEVFLHGHSSLNHDDVSNIPPMTPVTPMTPITPITPFTPMTPLTPGIGKPNSPPRSVTINAPSGLSMLGSVATTTSAAMSSMNSGRPPATPTRAQAASGDPSLNIVNHQHWIQLEEVASSILSMAQQLKIMIEQAKVQSEAMRESAVAQARIQAETDKREALSQVRYQSLAQLSQALATAQAEKTDAVQATMLKSCQNCGREAPLECTGCYKIYYCGTFCQKKDWVNHQKNCREAVHEQFQAISTTKDSTH